jgi:hypothetical protein
MNKPRRVSSPIYALSPTEVDGFDSLAELALDMRWSWNHSADEVWMQLDPVRHEMKRGKLLVGVENGYAFGAEVPATRPATDYMARVIPQRPGVAVPLEASRIL